MEEEEGLEEEEEESLQEEEDEEGFDDEDDLDEVLDFEDRECPDECLLVVFDDWRLLDEE